MHLCSIARVSTVDKARLCYSQERRGRTNQYAARLSRVKLNNRLSSAGYLDLVLRAKSGDDFYTVVRHEGRICWLGEANAIRQARFGRSGIYGGQEMLD